MVSFNDVLFQIFQPYFFYSLLFLSLVFICIKIFLKFNPSVSRRKQSILWLLPLFIPVSVLLYFHPQILITANSLSSLISPPPGSAIILLGPDVFSFTGLLCISGVIAAASYFVFATVCGKKIALRRFHVVMMAKDEYAFLQEKIKETSRQLGISESKVGLIDDLMPNAFTVGYGRNAVIVFSLGLLKMLNPEELAAVVSHELAHVKAKDYLFRSLTYTLNALSFFNPLSYFAASHAQKERELLADQKGATLLNKPLLMANVLTKLDAVALQFPKPRLADRLSSSLFLVSPLAHRLTLLASHPQISQRIQNIQTINYKPTKSHRRMASAILLLCILATITLIAGYSTMQVQKTCLQNENAQIINQYEVVMYNSSYPYTPQMGIHFANVESFIAFTSGQSGFLDAYGNFQATNHPFLNSAQAPG